MNATRERDAGVVAFPQKPHPQDERAASHIISPRASSAVGNVPGDHPTPLPSLDHLHLGKASSHPFKDSFVFLESDESSEPSSQTRKPNTPAKKVSEAADEFDVSDTDVSNVDVSDVSSDKSNFLMTKTAVQMMKVTANTAPAATVEVIPTAIMIHPTKKMQMKSTRGRQQKQRREQLKLPQPQLCGYQPHPRKKTR